MTPQVDPHGGSAEIRHSLFGGCVAGNRDARQGSRFSGVEKKWREIARWPLKVRMTYGDENYSSRLWNPLMRPYTSFV